MSGEEKTIKLTESELKTIVASTVLDTLTKLGVDSAEPLETQKDMAHLRNWRRSTETIKQRGMVTAVGFVIVSVLGLCLKAFLGK